ncbi:MAG: Delta-9 acyl-phospholipid desaturase [Actinomycetia bacterium]|nr:Delta-9 acyl-phospholipid desaturase [Actinomycetes bacterium]
MPRSRRPADERLNWVSSAPFLAFHLLPLAMLWTGVPVRALTMAAVLYFGRMFFITAGYHRYFSHRSYRVGRPVQFLLALGGATAMQRGPLWWAAHHRHHHRWSDTERDVHSPIRGFWWSHVGWILCDRYGATDFDAVKDLAKFPELRWLDRHDWVGPLGLAVITFAVGGWAGLVIGFGLSTVLLWHGTFLVNSLAHVVGRRRYLTSDTSRNSLVIALLTNGEGWHNNHHHYQASARQSFRWYQWDPSYYALWLLARVGVVHDLKTPTAAILARDLAGHGRFDLGDFRARWQVASERLAAFGTDVADALTARRHVLEARIEAARHELDESIRAQRLALADLAAVRRAARSRRPLPTWA